MPKIADIEKTPNPNALKFIMHEPLTWGITHSYDNMKEAKEDALASALFDIEHVTNVFYVDRWLTITQNGSADWQKLMRQLAVVIRAAPAAEVQSNRKVASANKLIGELSGENQERLNKINQLIDEQIRPYLQGDGGDLHVIGLEGNCLSIHYQGACGTCPSSIAGTLKSIENMLRTIESNIEVVAV